MAQAPLAKNITPQAPQAPKVKPNLKYMRDKDREMVKGIFRFHEVPGGLMSFTVRFYKEDQPETYTMIDGHIYTVPLGVARHLNKNLRYPVHAHTTEENGMPSMKIGSWVRRASFQSLEFVDIEDLSPSGSDLVTVEMSGLG